MHLIYTRFFHKALRDLGITKGKEPMLQLRNQGMVLGEDNEKMSKSRGNVISPDDLVADYGADTVRAYLMFFARWELGAPWNSSGIEGSARWLRKVWYSFLEPVDNAGTADKETLKVLRRKVHQTLAAVTRDYENFSFNTIVSGLMELMNEMTTAKTKGAFGTKEWEEAESIYLRMMAPVSPHIAEELWEKAGYDYSIHNQAWPEVDEAATKEEEITLIVQVNGKLRDRLVMPVDVSEADAKAAALSSENVIAFLEGKEPRKVIYVPGRLVNIVV
jgi:leucyl-tRNA synthetase